MNEMENKSILGGVNCPEDLKRLNKDKLNPLCEEIREKIIDTVSQNGGHLASNLGVVELTVALHRVFDCPRDKIIWDVGHQCYTHKILTGRRDQISSIRQGGGLSGFPRRNESIYDPFSAGHSSTSISAALGLARARDICGGDEHIISVIGDGALSGGLAYEGLNNAGDMKKKFIVVLNDNKMSISNNVGAVSRYLGAMRTRRSYLNAKSFVDGLLTKVPVLGDPARELILRSKSALKYLLYSATLFEHMGFAYYGPIDGHDINGIIEILEVIKKVERPVLLHVGTVKGKGYSFAEKKPNIFHGISSFDKKTGGQKEATGDFSGVFGKQLCKMAQGDKKICAITAAMTLGTGLSEFAVKFKDRFFDVGIAEGHAVTFAGGLAAGGLTPVVAVYSTFLQRSYDQIIHDVALQRLKVVLAIDRAGIVGEDGETHQGVFDVSFLNSVPGVTIYSPCYFDELKHDLKRAIYDCNGVVAVRYSRGSEGYRPEDFTPSFKDFDIYGSTSARVAVVTYGRIFSGACISRHELMKIDIEVCIVKLNKIKPIPEEAVRLLLEFEEVFFFEEGMVMGGVGQSLGYNLHHKGHKGGYSITGVDDKFICQAQMESTLMELKLDASGIKETILQAMAEGRYV